MSEKTIIHKRAAWRRIGRGIPGVPSETDPTVDLRNVRRPGQPKARGPNTARWVLYSGPVNTGTSCGKKD